MSIGPERARPAFDPDEDLLAAAVVPDPVQDPLGESHALRLHRRKDTIAAVGFFSRLFGKREAKTSEASRGMSKEDGLAAYVVREHRQGRALAEILDDPYLKNRATDEQRLRLLERPEVIRAVGEDTAAMAAEQVRETS
jgi:hypothetical protein